MNQPIRQHWVPKVYLSNFATEESKLAKSPQAYVLNVKSGEEFVTSIDNILLQKHLYTLGKNDAAPNFVIERTLSLIEGAAAASLKSMAVGEPVHCDKQQRVLVSYFLATLIMRTPRTLARQKRGFDSLANDPVSSLPEHLRRDDYREKVKVVNDWYQSLDETGQHLVFLKSLVSTAGIIAADLRKKGWSLFLAEDSFYISSDDPVVLYHSTERRYGVGTPGISLHVAISPKVMLMLGDTDVANEAAIHKTPPTIVETMNHLIASNAERFAISSTSFAPIKSAILAGRR